MLTDLIKNGFQIDKDMTMLKDLVKHKRIKNVYIDITKNNSSVLLLRSHEKNVSVIPDKERFIIAKNDNFDTYILNIHKKDIRDCLYQKYADNQHSFVFSMNDLIYKITVIK